MGATEKSGGRLRRRYQRMTGSLRWEDDISRVQPRHLTIPCSPSDLQRASRVAPVQSRPPSKCPVWRVSFAARQLLDLSVDHCGLLIGLFGSCFANVGKRRSTPCVLVRRFRDGGWVKASSVSNLGRFCCQPPSSPWGLGPDQRTQVLQEPEKVAIGATKISK